MKRSVLLVLALVACGQTGPSSKFQLATWDAARSEFACRHCGRNRIDPALVAALQELRNLAGQPINVTSGFRCPEHNRAVGGACHSYHLTGQAVDVRCDALNPAHLADLATRVPPFADGGIGVYPDHVHLDLRLKPTRWGDWHHSTTLEVTP